MACQSTLALAGVGIPPSRAGNDWINLLAVQSEGSMEWSDAGHLYFLIRRSALAKLDFSHVLAACSSS